MIKNKNGFTLTELVAVLVILAVISTIAAPLLLSLINKSKISANKRSVDSYGRVLEIGLMTYLMEHKVYPDSLKDVKAEYTGKEVVCKVMKLNENGSIYLSECSVGGVEVKDDTTDDGFYHYGKKIESPIETILSKVNEEEVTTYEVGSEASHQMYTFSYEAADENVSATEQNNSTPYKIKLLNQGASYDSDSLKDYRYIGSDPYNYVTFNDEMWRIIGVFNVENENDKQVQRMKIIKDESIGRYAYDTNNTNDWPNTTLNAYLNGDYYNSLTSIAQNMIGKTKFYLGGNDTYENLSGLDYYAFERGSKVYGENSTTWVGNIALMYPSDYIYTYANGVNNICFTDGYKCADTDENKVRSNWLYNDQGQRVISHNSLDNATVFLIYVHFLLANRGTSQCRAAYETSVRPTLYLKETVKIVDGDGTQDNPYQLSI